MCKSYGCDGIKEIRYYSMGGGERNNEPFNNGGDEIRQLYFLNSLYN